MNPQALKVIIYVTVTLAEVLQLVAIVLIKISQAAVHANPKLEITVPHIDIENWTVQWVVLSPEQDNSEPSSSDSHRSQAPYASLPPCITVTPSGLEPQI